MSSRLDQPDPAGEGRRFASPGSFREARSRSACLSWASPCSWWASSSSSSLVTTSSPASRDRPRGGMRDWGVLRTAEDQRRATTFACFTKSARLAILQPCPALGGTRASRRACFPDDNSHAPASRSASQWARPSGLHPNSRVSLSRRQPPEAPHHRPRSHPVGAPPPNRSIRGKPGARPAGRPAVPRACQEPGRQPGRREAAARCRLPVPIAASWPRRGARRC
jgi:hypothetical protein